MKELCVILGKCLKPIPFLAAALVLCFSAMPLTSRAQNVGISYTGETPDASAILDIVSERSGLLIPRVALQSETDLNTIAAPATSLLVYNINENMTNGQGPGFYFNSGTPDEPLWQKLLTSASLPFWSISGNEGIDPAQHFIGTTDEAPLIIKVNSQMAGVIEEQGGNTGLGFRVLHENTDGTFNTAFGFEALTLNKDGFSNVAVGVGALKNNLAGSNLVAIGDSALFFQGRELPDSTLVTGMEGFGNTAVGSKALLENTAGFYNTAIGAQALAGNYDGFANTSVGYQAMYNNTSGEQNVAVGTSSLLTNTVGLYNVAIGYQALGNADTSFNTAVGTEALGLTNKGFGNSALGDFAGNNNISGSYNTFVGKQANNAGFSNNATALGYLAQITGSNMVRIGGRGTTSIGGPAFWANTSDGRVKKDIAANVPGLSFIMKLRPVTYHIDEDAWDAIVPQSAHRGNPLLYDSTAAPTIHTGFIAQEVEDAAASLGYTFNGVYKPQNNNDLYGLAYGAFAVPLTKAVQEQQELIIALQQELQRAQQEIQMIQAELAAIQEKLN
jgi:hypothetical protein